MTELDQLREEVAALRKEVAALRADRAVHHYHHQAAPAPFVQPSSPSIPSWPGYFPATCGGVASGGVGMALDTSTLFYNGDGASAGARC